MNNQQLTITNELDAYVKEYNTNLSNVLNKLAPLNIRTRVSRPIVPWNSEVIDHAIRSRRKAERRWIRLI